MGENMKKVFIIGFGSKARQGKDTSAEFIKELRKNVHIIHFADAVKEECSNPKKEFPLISETIVNGVPMYLLLDRDNKFQMFYKEQLPKLQKIFDDRGINQYFAMESKDGEILQFWGTEFRRMQVNDRYWINKVDEKIQNILANVDGSDEPVYILVPDTRFKNEFNYIKSWDKSVFAKGIYVNVRRYNEDNQGSRYLATDRDPNHPSEIGLDDVEPDYYLDAFNLDELKRKVALLLHRIELGECIEDLEKHAPQWHE